MKKIKQTLLIFCCFTLMVQTPFVVAELPAVGDGPGASLLSGSEYFVGAKLGQPLISVKLLNGVSKPGVYHIPMGTNLGELIAYAGGATSNANLDEIIVKRFGLGEVKNYEVDLEKVFASTTHVPKLVDKDMVYIDTDVKLDQTMRWLSIVSGVLTIALTAFLIAERSDD